MDDSCAVCAESLDWVAYGPCGHREVCSTCVVRLRFILDDRRCCICKSDNPHVFITKAMGDYTRVITDFAMFPAGATEGRNGEFWYHEDTQAYFDDADQYRMIKATCKLSCSVCDSSSEYSGPRRISAFKNIEQLKGHLHHQHRMVMCTLVWKGGRFTSCYPLRFSPQVYYIQVFICEQRLYNRSQLDQHISTGDSEVDGSENERGGFMGHPMCEFCRNPFYGDNELFVHMSRDHYKCFICERQHPGQYDYYRNYNDLEIHFRQGHFLCEDENCLEEKFIVFQTEAEMKRHHASKHGGNMTRAQRKDALQIPTSFRYQRNNEQDQRRNRGRGFRSGDFVRQSNMEGGSSTGTRSVPNMTETNPSVEMSSLELLTINPDAEPPSSVSHTQSSRSAPIIEESSFPPLSDRVPPETSSRYAQLVHSSRNPARLGEESFPPLPGGQTRSKPKANPRSENLGKSSLAAHLRNKRAVVVHKSAWSRPSENNGASPSVSASSQNKPARKPGISSPAISHSQGADQGSPSTSSVVQVKPVRENELTPPVLPNSTWNSNAANKMRHSASAPIIVGGSTPIMASTLRGSQAMPTSQVMPTSSQALPDVKDVQTANKSLVERIRAGLEMNEDRFAAFKNISLEYRQEQINTWEYLSYVQQFGLSHLVLELAQNCPDPRKQKELIDAYNANFRGKVVQENGGNSAPTPKEGKQWKAKGKGKEVDYGNSSSTADALTDSILDTVRKLQSYAKPQEVEVETLSKDGYRKQQPPSKKGQASSRSLATNLSGSDGSREAPVNTSSNQNVGGGGSKQKKTSKFHRIRLGDGSSAALVDPGPANASPERPSNHHEEEGVVPVRGVWRNGGGLKIVKSQKNQ